MLRDYGARALKITVLLASLALLGAAVATASPQSAKDDSTPPAAVCDPSIVDCAGADDPSADIDEGTDSGDIECDPSIDESCDVAGDEATGGDDDFVGEESDDKAELGDGDDVADGGDGNDDLVGGAGNDVLNGGAGNDHLVGGPGADRENGGAGNDVVEGSPGADKLVGGPGKDTLLGGRGADVLQARDGKRDVVRCGPGRDRAVVDRVDVARGCELVTRR